MRVHQFGDQYSIRIRIYKYMIIAKPLALPVWHPMYFYRELDIGKPPP